MRAGASAAGGAGSDADARPRSPATSTGRPPAAATSASRVPDVASSRTGAAFSTRYASSGRVCRGDSGTASPPARRIASNVRR